MLLYQIVCIFITVIALIAIIIRRKEGRGSQLSFVISLLLVFAIIISAIFPDMTTSIAKLFGINRGLDFILIVGIFGCYLILYKIYSMLDNLEDELTELVRKIALKDEFNESDEN